jgi:hypothetical protein
MAIGDLALPQVARKAVTFCQCFHYINYTPGSQIPSHALMAQWHQGLTSCVIIRTDGPSTAAATMSFCCSVILVACPIANPAFIVCNARSKPFHFVPVLGGADRRRRQKCAAIVT